MNYLIAIDVGTQSTRVALIGEDGEIVRIVQSPHDVDTPHPSWAQQSPDLWWSEVCKNSQELWASVEVRQKSILPSQVAAICCCGQMHGMVGVDPAGQVTTPMVQLWCDKRCHVQCSDFKNRYDELELAQTTANPVVPSWTALKVRWFAENTSEAYQSARWFLVPKDFVNYRLTGVAATDPSEASGSYIWDWKKDDYSLEIAKLVGVDPGKFAPSCKASAVIGSVTAEAARETGFQAGTPVVAGGGDFPVSMLGFGIVGEGIANDTTGTSTCFAVHSPKPLIHPLVFNLRHVTDGWIPFKLTDSGGIAGAWLRQFLATACGLDENDKAAFGYERMIALAEQAPAGSDGLIFYPYLLGERRLENTAARGAFLGVTLNHKAPHFARAALEGVALSMASDFRLFSQLGVNMKRLLSVGGGTRNRLWNQMKADMTGLPVELAAEPEAGLKGCALLASAGVGLIDDLNAEARKRCVVEKKVAPNPENRAVYDQALEQFQKIYDRLLGFWN